MTKVFLRAARKWAAGMGAVLMAGTIAPFAVSAAPAPRHRAQAGNNGTWRPRIEARLGENGSGELYVNDALVLRLRTVAGGVDPFTRAQIAAERLTALVAGGVQAGEIVADVATDPAAPRLKGAGQLIAFADKVEAKADGDAPGSLVRGWASAMRAALAQPGITASDSDILVPLGETRSLRLGGVARGSLVITSAGGQAFLPDSAPPETPDAATTPAPKSVIAVTDPNPSDSASVVSVRGLAPGRETLQFNRDGATISVAVRVQPYAGHFDAPRPVVVTGHGIEIERVARYAAAAALASAVPNAGAIARVGTDTLSVALPLAPGAQSTVSVPVSLIGPDMISVRTSVSVPLQNAALPAVTTGSLLYSNNPERVSGYGTLFAARLPQNAAGSASPATRLLYHHQSAMPTAVYFSVELLNDADAPTTVQIVGDGAGPVKDTVWVGYRATAGFLHDYLAGAGMIVEIPPHARFPLLSTRLPPGQTVSGLYQVRPLAGPAPLVRVAAQPATDARAQAEAWQPSPILPGELGRDGSTLAYDLSEHIYPDPIKRIEARYEIGGNWAFIGIGKDALDAVNKAGKNRNTDNKLYGNYGVWYEIVATLHNPLSRPALAHVVFVPSAGLAGGVFVVDGKLVNVPQTNVGREPNLGTYRLNPDETRTVRISTLPLGGSNYPARIVIHP